MTNLVLAQAAAPPPPAGLLITAALVSIALIVVLITRFKVHPFLSLTIGSLVTGVIAGLSVHSLTTVARMAAPVGVTSSPVTTDGASGTPLSSSAVNNSRPRDHVSIASCPINSAWKLFDQPSVVCWASEHIDAMMVSTGR